MTEQYKYGEKSFPNGYNSIVALLLKNISLITPNKITILGLTILIASTLLMSYFSGTYKIIRILLGPLWVFIDYLDGSLA